MISGFRSKLFGVSALIVVSAPSMVSAATMAVSNSIYTSENSNMGAVSLTPFDPTLGPLTGLTFTFSGVVQNQLQNLGSLANGIDTATVYVEPTFVSSPISVATTTFTITGNGLFTSSQAAATFSFTAPSTALAQFTNASTDTINLDPFFVLTDSNGNVLADDGNDAYIAGTLTENFTYTVASLTQVDEPASAMLLLAGVAGLSALARRKAL